MKLMHRYNACGDDGDVEFMERITELLNRGPLVTEMSIKRLDKYKDTFSWGVSTCCLACLKSYWDRTDEDALVRPPRTSSSCTNLPARMLSPPLCNVLYENDKMSIAKNSLHVRYREDYLDTMGNCMECSSLL